MVEWIMEKREIFKTIFSLNVFSLLPQNMYSAAMSQAQPAYRNQPGTPTKNIVNRPPNMLQVQY